MSSSHCVAECGACESICASAGSRVGQTGRPYLLGRHVQAFHHAVLIEPRLDRGSWARRQPRLKLVVRDATVCAQRYQRLGDGLGIEPHSQQSALELGQLEFAVGVDVPLIKDGTEAGRRWWRQRWHWRPLLAVEELVPPRGLLDEQRVAGSGSANGRRECHARSQQTPRGQRYEKCKHSVGVASAPGVALSPSIGTEIRTARGSSDNFLEMADASSPSPARFSEEARSPLTLTD